MPGTDGSIMNAAFPFDNPDAADIPYDPESESKMEMITGIITGIRNVRGEMNISPSLHLNVSVQSQEESTREIINTYKDIIINLAKLDSFVVTVPGERPRAAATSVVNGATIFVSLEDIIDFQKEISRLEKEINKLDKELAAVSKKLENEDFLSKAPQEIVEKVREKYNIHFEKQRKLQTNLDKIKAVEI